MKKIISLCLVGLLLSFTVVLLAKPDIMRYTGCGIVKKAFMKEMGKAFMKKYGTKVLITGGGATKGVRHAAAQKVDFGGGCRHKLNVAEEKMALKHRVAWDALVAIVHPSNPVKNLSLKQLKDILTGRIKNWKEVGGNDEKIQVMARVGKISGVGLMARELIFKNAKQDFVKTAKIFPSSGPLEKGVERFKNAIGVTGISSGRKRKVNFLTLNNIKPSYNNIKTGKYPLFRPLYLFTHGKPTGKVKQFIDFVLSAEGQAVIKSQKTVTLADGKGLLAPYSKKMKRLGVSAKLWK